MHIDPAMESIFANAEQSAASLIELATLAINAKVNTIEEAENMIAQLSEEAAKYNELLTSIMNAMRQVESGDMSKADAAAIVAPAVKELKDKCTALKITNADVSGDDISEEEITILRELIIGAKAAAEDRLVAIRLGDDEREDDDVKDLMTTEAIGLAGKYVSTAEVKTADKLYSNAKKLHSKAPDKAIEYMQKAKELYSEALTNLLNSGKFSKTENTTMVKGSGSKQFSRRSTGLTTDKISFDLARKHLENKVDKCTARIMTWTARTDMTKYDEILAQVKADRELAKENYEMEDSSMNFDMVYETMMDLYIMEEESYAEAMEGVNADVRRMKKDYSKELRATAKEAKKLYKQGNYSAAKAAYTKCASLANDFADEVSARAKDQTWIENYIGNLLHTLRSLVYCVPVYGIIKAFKDTQASVDDKISILNKLGKGEVSQGDLNMYTRFIVQTAKTAADKFKKLADKAGKAELTKQNATESFDYDEYEFSDMAFETMMDLCIMEEGSYAEAMEGVNADVRRMKKDYSKELRATVKEAKKLYKQGNYSAAKAAYTKCASLANDFASEVSERAKDQTWIENYIGNLLHTLRSLVYCVPVYGIIKAFKDTQAGVDDKISILNKLGKGELERGDLNMYTRFIVQTAKTAADKFKKLADKAGKAELTKQNATESFDYDEFMFACEAMMDELQADLDYTFAMESEGSDEAETPSAMGQKIRSKFSKLGRAIKKGDQKAIAEAEEEVSDTISEMEELESSGSETTKKGMNKALKVGLIAAGTVAAAAGLTAAGIAIKQKASGGQVNVKEGFKAMRATMSSAVKNASEARKNRPINAKFKDVTNDKALVPYGHEFKDPAKKKLSKKAKIGIGVGAGAAGVGGTALALHKKSKRQDEEDAADAAAESLAETFGISKYDAYDLILEAFESVGYSASEESLLDMINDI